MAVPRPRNRSGVPPPLIGDPLNADITRPPKHQRRSANGATKVPWRARHPPAAAADGVDHDTSPIFEVPASQATLPYPASHAPSPILYGPEVVVRSTAEAVHAVAKEIEV